MINPLDLIRSSEDGSLSLTKLAAATAHAVVAIIFVRQQWDSPFNETQWLVYLGATIFHAAYDKTAAQVKEVRIRSKQADVAMVKAETEAAKQG